MKKYSSSALFALSLTAGCNQAVGFSHPLALGNADPKTSLSMGATEDENRSSRREFFQQSIQQASMAVAVGTVNPQWVYAADDAPQKMFAPGGTLVDYQVGITVGNDGASKSRRNDNSNVIFGQDYYYKFGTAPRFIPPGDTSFPAKMPFVLSQQRYDALKKYRDRVQRGIGKVADLKEAILAGNYASIPVGDDPEYSIRPLGLLANSFFASENTGTTNELFLARWYINEIYLDIGDIKSASSQQAAQTSYDNAILALNSYLGMLNRSIIPKVGDPFALVGVAPPTPPPAMESVGSSQES